MQPAERQSAGHDQPEPDHAAIDHMGDLPEAVAGAREELLRGEDDVTRGAEGDAEDAVGDDAAAERQRRNVAAAGRDRRAGGNPGRLRLPPA